MRVCFRKKMYNEVLKNIMSLGFIITRCVHSEKHDVLWKECVSCIRSFYPLNTIIIIDDYSSIDIDTSSMSNVLVEKHSSDISSQKNSVYTHFNFCFKYGTFP